MENGEFIAWKRRSSYIIAVIIVMVSSIVFYAGHFLFGDQEQDISEERVAETPYVPFPVNHVHLMEIIKGHKQEIDILEIVPGDSRVKIFPSLSFDRLFGFEKLSEIALRTNAYALVNAGFFYEYGLPSGMVAINGELITASTGKYPVFIVSNGSAYLKEIETNLLLECNGVRISADNMNSPGKSSGVVVYTPWYGSNNRAEGMNITAVIKNGRVIGINEVRGETQIPDDGMLVTFFEPYKYDMDSFPLVPGEEVEFIQSPVLDSSTQAYECGSWIVKDGEVVIGDKDSWVGVLTNRDPRTAVGLKPDGTVILMTVDGRQPDYSDGVTSRELGEFLVEYGVTQAAMLDGGASTEMIIQGEIVNRPSFRGEERPLAGAIVVQYDEEGLNNQ